MEHGHDEFLAAAPAASHFEVGMTSAAEVEIMHNTPIPERLPRPHTQLADVLDLPMPSQPSLSFDNQFSTSSSHVRDNVVSVQFAPPAASVLPLAGRSLVIPSFAHQADLMQVFGLEPYPLLLKDPPQALAFLWSHIDTRLPVLILGDGNDPAHVHKICNELIYGALNNLKFLIGEVRVQTQLENRNFVYRSQLSPHYRVTAPRQTVDEAHWTDADPTELQVGDSNETETE